MPMEIIPLDAALGAEIRGLDLSVDIDEPTFKQLRTAYYEHSLLLFRDQALSPARQVAFSRRFGELSIHVLDQWRLADQPEVLIISNLKDGDRHVGVYNAGRYWHTDLSYMQAPSAGSILHAIEVPHQGDRALGDTLFASTAVAYEHLPAATKERIANLTATFSLEHQRAKLRAEGDNVHLTAEQQAKVPTCTHHIVQRHPVTGRKVLFINEGHTIAILGLSAADGRELLGQLTNHVTDERFVYRHRWQVGDVLMWDNIATQHLATFDYALPQRRYMHRTTLQGVELY